MLFGWIARFFVSFLVSNWIYSEVVLLCPPVDRYAKDLYQASKLPTHDKWGRIASNSAADRLGLDLERQISTTSPRAGLSFARFFDDSIRELWSSKSLQSVFAVFGDNSLSALPSQRASFLSGEDIFSSHTVAAIKHVRF